MIETDDGIFRARFSERGLAGLDFPGRRADSPAQPDDLSPQQQGWVRVTERALKRVLAGKTPKALPPLDLSNGTDFQQKVWSALRKIPAGKARSYAEVARAAGRPAAVRAVGQACGANPIPVLIPCHRVIAAHGKLGGFSSGLEWKRKLLAREKVGFDGQLSFGLLE
jgi:O-6-methylguanine DNA methyltransferase